MVRNVQRTFKKSAVVGTKAVAQLIIVQKCGPLCELIS